MPLAEVAPEPVAAVELLPVVGAAPLLVLKPVPPAPVVADPVEPLPVAPLPVVPPGGVRVPLVAVPPGGVVVPLAAVEPVPGSATEIPGPALGSARRPVVPLPVVGAVRVPPGGGVVEVPVPEPAGVSFTTSHGRRLADRVVAGGPSLTLTRVWGCCSIGSSSVGSENRK